MVDSTYLLAGDPNTMRDQGQAKSYVIYDNPFINKKKD